VMSWVREMDDICLQRYVGPRSEVGSQAGTGRHQVDRCRFLNEVMPESPSIARSSLFLKLMYSRPVTSSSAAKSFWSKERVGTWPGTGEFPRSSSSFNNVHTHYWAAPSATLALGMHLAQVQCRALNSTLLQVQITTRPRNSSRIPKISESNDGLLYFTSARARLFEARGIL